MARKESMPSSSSPSQPNNKRAGSERNTLSCLVHDTHFGVLMHIYFRDLATNSDFLPGTFSPRDYK